MSEVLSVKEKIGYGMGDAASHIIFDNVMLYMMFFYTDIFGIPAGFVGTMFLLARALDAISDPCMGLIADRTRSRWGKFRPWILFGAIPFGIVCVLAYTTPDLSLNGKMVYAAVTYTLLTLLYTVVNIPYCALGGVITSDPTQRISLQSWRFVLATAGGMLSTVLMMPLVKLIGGDDKAFGFQGGIAVLSVVAFLMLAFCFFTTKERIQVPPSTTLIGSALAKPLTDWKCKVSIFWWTNAALAVVSVAMFFVPMHATVLMFAFIFVIGVLHQLVTPIQWVMMSDTVDYGEWTNGKRLTGISFAGTLFVLKLGLALGGAMIGWMLAGGGYDAAAKTQNSATISIIIGLFTLAPAVCYVLSAIIAKRYYTLKTPFLTKILAELAQGARRNQQEFENLPVSKELQN
ncbi:MAG: glycoside-pentoside-hexuronide (GPH):cation symporter [Enterobacter roggenkampii]|nr:glycoside-pentoside-hexuronide (GPH):cation symporter [Enterobacter roggenkampii]